MPYNLGYVDANGYNAGYVGVYNLADYPYSFTDHGLAHPNSFLAEANFGTTDEVRLGILSDFDPAKLVVDWAAITSNLRWRDDIATLSEVTVTATADTSDTVTIRWYIPSTGQSGQFDVTVQIQSVGVPTNLRVSNVQATSVRLEWDDA